jgi:hypothetical protein
VFEAIHNGRPDQELLSYQYLQMLPQLAQGDANKVFVIPSEFAEAFRGIAKALPGASEAEHQTENEHQPVAEIPPPDSPDWSKS